MRTITRNDVLPVITKMIEDHPGPDSGGRLWTTTGNGQCFVGTLLDRHGVSPRQADDLRVQFDSVISPAWTDEVSLLGMSEGMLPQYTFSKTGREPFRFDEELRGDLSASITMNDQGVPWSEIGQKVWGIEVQPDPLPPIKPVKIMPNPPITTKKDAVDMALYNATVKYYEKQFNKIYC